jgi:hypothetical protein
VDGERNIATAPAVVATYPRPGALDAYLDVVPKASFSEPVTRVDSNTFTLVDRSGTRVPASVHQIGDGTWGLFPDRVFLKPGETYTARVAPGVCGFAETCTTEAVAWKFTVASRPENSAGDTTIPAGFPAGQQRVAKTQR